MYNYEYNDGKLMIGGVAADELVKEFGSPLYAYDEDIIREKFETLKSQIRYPNKTIFYAMKANNNLSILKILKDEGCGIDAVSLEEVEIALRLGFDNKKIIFTGLNIKDEEYDYALSKGILFNIGSLHSLKKYGERHPGTEICIRINPNIGAGHHDHCITGGVKSKFGIFQTQLDEAKDLLEKYNLKLIGIHSHIGSGIIDYRKYIDMMEIILNIAGSFMGIKFIDFGGGIGIAYKPEKEDFDLFKFGDTVTKLMEGFSVSYGSSTDMYLEPGRFIVAESGFLLATVEDIKTTPKFEFVGVDSGFNHLIRPSMYGSHHEIVNASNAFDKKRDVAVSGYLCETGDVFTMDDNGITTQKISNPKEGDVLAVLTSGAYGFAMSSNYNFRTRPAEVLVKNGKAKLVRRRETIEDLIDTQEGMF